jgi:hypothetical protein
MHDPCRKDRISKSSRALKIAAFLLLPFLQGSEVVILPADDPLLAETAMNRGELAKALVSYSPVSLLQKLSKGNAVPATGASEEEIWSFLNRTGILPAMSDGLNYPLDTVTRSHMAILLQGMIRMLAPQSPRSSVQVPVDLDPGRYDALPILEILSYGLMATDSAGRFMPDDPISGRDAIETILSLRAFSRGR